MPRLNVDQKSILGLLGDKKTKFLIPDYQRPYAWGEDECATLWDDIFMFSFPNPEDPKEFVKGDEYFLGPIVTFANGESQLEIIDGQQRLTTIMLLLRAFYSEFDSLSQQDAETKRMLDSLGSCIWETNELGTPDKELLKIDSEVASDEDKEEFLSILRTGQVAPGSKSRYAWVYDFFLDKVQDFMRNYLDVLLLPTRIMNNVILLPIEADSQTTALRIFSTLNDRGLPLSDADIFKSQFYKYYSAKKEKDDFVRRWSEIEEICGKIFRPSSGSPMDELFTRYMYYQRAIQGNRDTTTEALRSFYEKNEYEILKQDGTLSDLEALVSFWQDVESQDEERFSERVLRRLFVLNYAPNGMWTYIVSTYFLVYQDGEGKLEEQEFYDFLNLITAFIWSYAIDRPGVNALRTPVFPELINIVNKRPVTFENSRFSRASIKAKFENFEFTNQRTVTRSMLTWWAYNDDDQVLFDLDTKLDIEHIYARKRAEFGDPLKNPANLEALGNKVLLERKVNIRAADYRFEDKKNYYLGLPTGKGKAREGTKVAELQKLANSLDDFTEADIEARTEKIIDTFVDYLGQNKLLKD